MKLPYKALAIFAAIIAIVGIFIISRPSEAEATSYTATVERVVDGDTVNLNNEVLGTKKVRLLSIDAPETNYQGKNQQPWGGDAKNYLSQLLPPGTSITVQTDVEEKDSYGRLLAHIFKGDLDINKEMVRQGHAVTYYIWPNTLHFAEYQTAYQEARAAELGMWNTTNPITELPFEFRDRASNGTQDKYVGNYDTKQYVSPEAYQQIPIEKRLFFFTESDARKAQYTKAGDVVAQSDVVINEIAPAPSDASAKEFVELYNAGTKTVDISRWILDDVTNGGSSPYTIPAGTLLAANSFYVWETSNYYNNGSDTVTLKNQVGAVVDQYNYTASARDASWYRSPDGGEWAKQQSTSPTKGNTNQ